MTSEVSTFASRPKLLQALAVLAKAVSVAFALAAVAIVAYFTPLFPLGFDQAFNLQIAHSLAGHFAYVNTYVPSIVYDPHVTSNGPMQYFAAVLWRVSGSMEVAREGALIMGMALLVAALYLLRYWLTCFPVFFLLGWSIFLKVSTAFVGEIWELAFLMFGLYAMLRLPHEFDFRRWLSRPALFAAALFFALSIASKLLAVSIVMPLVLGFALTRARPWSLRTFLHVVLFSGALAVLVSAVFVLQFAFSVIHTTRHPFDFSQVASSLVAFVKGHIGQANASAAAALSPVHRILHFDNPYVPLLVLVMGLLLIVAKPGYLPLLATAFVLWGHYAFDERRLLPMAFAIIVFGALAAEDLLSRITVRSNLPLETVKGAVLAAACITFAGLSAAAHAPSPNALVRKWAMDEGSLDRVVQTSRGPFVYSPRLIGLLKRYRYVLASGWWQFPDITIWHNLHFYDRMAAVNAGIPPDRSVLIFDSGNHLWPRTSEHGNCRKLVYVDGPIVLCRPRTDVPLNYQPPNFRAAD